MVGKTQPESMEVFTQADITVVTLMILYFHHFNTLNSSFLLREHK